MDAIDEDGAILILVRDKSKAGEDIPDAECENAQLHKSSVIHGPESPLGKFAMTARETVMDVEHRVQQEERAAVQCIVHQATFVIRPGEIPLVVMVYSRSSMSNVFLLSPSVPN